MALFSKYNKNTTENLWESDISKELQPQDGHEHVLMMQSFSRIIDQNLGADTKYDAEINVVLDGIQNAGREIVDVKFAVLRDQGITGTREGYRTMIIYK